MTLSEFVAALNEKFKGTGYQFSATDKGGKYTRVVQTDGPAHRSVFCFVDAEGNIYKPASWKAPAKGVRATLATLDTSIIDPYGSWLYR